MNRTLVSRYRGELSHSFGSLQLCRSMSSNSTPYKITSLVLDLDAAENTRVRLHDEKDEKDEAYGRTIKKARKIARRKRLPHDPPGRPVLSKRNIRAVDLLHGALLGSSPPRYQNLIARDCRRLHRQYMELLATHNPPGDRDVVRNTIIQAGLNSPLGLDSENTSERSLIASAIILWLQVKQCNSFDTLQTTVLSRATTERGCISIRLAADAIVRRIRYLATTSVSRGPTMTKQVIYFINNIAANLERHSIPLGGELCCCGIAYSLKLGNGPLKYMRLASLNLWPPDTSVLKALQHFEKNLKQNKSCNVKWFANGLKILTGWAENGHPEAHEKRSTCLATYFTSFPRQFRRFLPYYIRLLATLGAGDAVRYEWRFTFPHLYFSSSDKVDVVSAFLEAFIKTDDLWRALKMCHSTISQLNLRRIRRLHKKELNEYEMQYQSIWETLQSRYARIGTVMLDEIASDIHKPHRLRPSILTEFERTIHIRWVIDEAAEGGGYYVRIPTFAASQRA
jgi:hypothetical protein